MNILSGEIGKLSLNGEQVGGFKYWTVIIKKNPLNTRVIASQYWMLKKVETNKLIASFFIESKKGYKLVREKEVIVNIPDCKLDTMITSPIEMDLGNIDFRE